MKEIFYVLLVLTVFRLKTASCSHSQIHSIQHLPANIEPLKHDLKIYTEFEDEKYLFHGNVRITIRCEEETRLIVLNRKELLIVQSEVTVQPFDERKESIKVADHKYDPTKDLYTIILRDDLKKGLLYEVFVPFKKEKSTYNDVGYIRYEYTKEPNKPKKVIAVTISDVNDARRFFPGFDLISMKTNFNLQLGLPTNQPNLKGVSSLKFISNVPDPDKKDWSLATFEGSHLISTYSFAFLVANLESKSETHVKAEVVLTVWADEAVIGKMDPTLTLLVKVFNFYYEYFESKPSINALYLIALPNIREMKTEKSGFILLEESTVLPADPSNDESEADILWRLCYEVGRQWIGAGATMSQWNQYWLDTGLASVLQALCFKKLFPKETQDILDLQFVETFTRVLRIDGESVRPVYVDEVDFNLKKMFTETVLSDKAFLMARMIKYVFGDTEFQKGLKQYFHQYNLSSSSLDQVWAVFQGTAEKANVLPNGITVKAFMESWTKKKGYSLVRMERDFTLSKATLKQSRFLQLDDQGREGEHFKGTDYRIIPLSYATKTQLKENEGKELPVKIEWLKYSISISPAANEMILVNMGMKVLCRVLYDKISQQMISDTLKNKAEFKIIDPVTRAYLISDIFALAAVGKVDYDMLFSTMLYLKHEDSDFALMVALYEFNAIRSGLFDQSDGLLKNYEEWVNKILTPIFQREQFVIIRDLPNDSQKLLLKKLVIESACTFGVPECISQCKSLFNEWHHSSRPDKDNLIPLAIREIVFREAIKHGGLDEFQFLWNQFDKDKEQRFNEDVLTALGCFNQDKFLDAFLHYSIFINPEMPKYSFAIASGLVMNENGYAAAKNFFTARKNDIKERSEIYKGLFVSFLVKLFEVTNSLYDLQDLVQIRDSGRALLHGSENLLKESVLKAKRNSLWVKKHADTFIRLLSTHKRFDPSSAFEMKLV